MVAGTVYLRWAMEILVHLHVIMVTLDMMAQRQFLVPHVAMLHTIQSLLQQVVVLHAILLLVTLIYQQELSGLTALHAVVTA